MPKDCLRLYSVSFKTFFLSVKIQKLRKVWHIRSSAIHMEKREFRDYFLKTSYDAQMCTLVDLFCFTI